MLTHLLFRSRVAIFVSGVALTCAACGSTERDVRVQTAVTSAPTTNYVKTYAFGDMEQAPARYRTSPNSGEATRHMKGMIEEDLRAKGYIPAKSIADADLVWMFAAGRREREKKVHEYQHGGIDAFSGDDPDTEFEEGAVVIDALDGKTGKRVWHGFGRTEIDPNKVDDALLRKAVDQVMVRFPSAGIPVDLTPTKAEVARPAPEATQPQAAPVSPTSTTP